MFSGLNLQRKLQLLLGAPLAAAALFALMHLVQQWQIYQQASAVDELVAAALKIDQTRSNLAEEVGLSTAVINRGGNLFAEPLRERRKQVDIGFQQVAELAESDTFGGSYQDLESQIRELAESYQRLLQLRREVDQRRSLQLQEEFSVLLKHADRTLAAIARRFRDPRTRALTRGLLLLLEAREYASNLRRSGMRVLLSHEITQEQSLRFSVDANALDAELQRFFVQEDIDLRFQSALRAGLASAKTDVLSGLEQNIFYHSRKQQLLNKLNNLIGYGGLIHDYKDYLLSGDARFQESFRQKHEKTLTIVTEIQSLPGAPSRDAKLAQEVLRVFEVYGGNFELVDTLRTMETPADLILTQVHVDDANALIALTELGEFSTDIAVMNWWESSTRRVDALTEVIGHIHAELQEHAQGAASRSLRDLWLNVLFLIAVFSFTLFLAISIFRRTIGGVRATVDALHEVALTGDLKVPLPSSGHDEVGQLAASLRRIIGRLNKVVKQAEIIGRGDFSQQVEELTDRDSLAIAFNRMVANTREVIDKAGQIARGEYDIKIEMRSEEDYLGRALTAMARGLRELESANQADRWIREGRAQLAKLLSSNENTEILARKAVRYLATYVSAPAATLYQLSDDRLRLLHQCGADEDVRAREEIALGGGLLGRAAEEGKNLCLEDVPAGFFDLQTSLGKAAAGAVAIIPLISDECVGVMEFAFVEKPSEATRELLESASSLVAVALLRAESQARLAELLEESRDQANELRASEEELQAQSEELQAANEELRQRSDELEERNLEIETARKEIEEKAREVEQASRYKSEFLANMSHELRTPLNSMLILSQMLAENEEDNLTEDQTESARIINDAGKNLLKLINEILDLSKVEAGKIEFHFDDFDLRLLARTLEERYRPLATQKGLSLSMVVDEDVPERLRSDSMRIEQVVTNLVSNALKFTEQGAVTLHMRAVKDETELHAGFELQPGMIAIDVEDTGIGIPSDKLAKVFRAFEQADGSTTRKFGGTGLGLAISREMAKLLGGDIQVQSRVGEGSTFTLYVVPATDAHPVDVAVAPEVESAVQASMPRRDVPAPAVKLPRPDDRNTIAEGEACVVVVEDDPIFLGVLMDVVRERGYKVVANLDGPSGIESVRRFLPIGVMLDVNLPRADGWAVMEAIKSDPVTRHIPVHFVSAEDQSLRASRSGAIGFSIKPVDRAELREAMQGFENLHQDPVRNILVIEDDSDDQKLIREALAGEDLHLTFVRTAREGLEKLRTESYHCVVLDRRLPDMSGEALLEAVVAEGLTLPPVVMHTGGDMTGEEEERLRRFTDRIVLKTADSASRLLDEATLFLHHIAPEDGPDARRKPSSGKVTFQGQTVLLVDDDMRNVFALARVLQSKGLKVIKAPGGERALQAMEEHGEEIKLVLMDIMMPGMDGYEAMRRIRQMPNGEAVPIIALTALAMKGDREKCLAAGATDYLSKPVDTPKLVALLEHHLSSMENLAPAGR